MIAGVGLYGLDKLGSGAGGRAPKQFKAHSLKEHLVIARGDAAAPEDEERVVTQMAYAAIEELGGMGALVGRGDKVLIKPNMSFDRRPPFAANTNPWLVAALAEMCLAAGASRVRVLDNPFARDHLPPYRSSGIMQAAQKAGAEVVFVDPTSFLNVEIPDGLALKSWPFLKEVYFQGETDVLINVPIAKDHGRTRLSLSMKNVMGMTDGERGALHVDIHRKLADLNKIAKVDLTVLDAYRILRKHGPTGGRLSDVDNSTENARRIVACADRVSVDAYATTLFGLKPEDIGYIAEAHKAGIGRMDWNARSVKEISI